VAQTTNFTTNCQQTLSTTYTIESVGGKNMLRFAMQPTWVMSSRGFAQSFTEHNGAVYYSGRSIDGYVGYSQRLNGTAVNSLLSLFGVSLPAQTLTAP
jgi:hypothetical protein